MRINNAYASSVDDRAQMWIKDKRYEFSSNAGAVIYLPTHLWI